MSITPAKSVDKAPNSPSDTHQDVPLLSVFDKMREQNTTSVCIKIFTSSWEVAGKLIEIDRNKYVQSMLNYAYGKTAPKIMLSDRYRISASYGNPNSIHRLSSPKQIRHAIATIKSINDTPAKIYTTLHAYVAESWWINRQDKYHFDMADKVTSFTIAHHGLSHSASHQLVLRNLHLKAPPTPQELVDLLRDFAKYFSNKGCTPTRCSSSGRNANGKHAMMVQLLGDDIAPQSPSSKFTDPRSAKQSSLTWLNVLYFEFDNIQNIHDVIGFTPNKKNSNHGQIKLATPSSPSMVEASMVKLKTSKRSNTPKVVPLQTLNDTPSNTNAIESTPAKTLSTPKKTTTKKVTNSPFKQLMSKDHFTDVDVLNFAKETDDVTSLTTTIFAISNLDDLSQIPADSGAKLYWDTIDNIRKATKDGITPDLRPLMDSSIFKSRRIAETFKIVLNHINQMDKAAKLQMLKLLVDAIYVNNMDNLDGTKSSHQVRKSKRRQ